MFVFNINAHPLDVARRVIARFEKRGAFPSFRQGIRCRGARANRICWRAATTRRARSTAASARWTRSVTPPTRSCRASCENWRPSSPTNTSTSAEMRSPSSAGEWLITDILSFLYSGIVYNISVITTRTTMSGEQRKRKKNGKKKKKKKKIPSAMGCWCSDCIFVINLHNFRIGSHLQAKQPRDSWIHEYQWIRESLWEVGRIIYAEVSIDGMAFSVSAKQFFSVLLQREASWSSSISAVKKLIVLLLMTQAFFG